MDTEKINRKEVIRRDFQNGGCLKSCCFGIMLFSIPYILLFWFFHFSTMWFVEYQIPKLPISQEDMEKWNDMLNQPDQAYILRYVSRDLSVAYVVYREENEEKVADWFQRYPDRIELAPGIYMRTNNFGNFETVKMFHKKVFLGIIYIPFFIIYVIGAPLMLWKRNFPYQNRLVSGFFYGAPILLGSIWLINFVPFFFWGLPFADYPELRKMFMVSMFVSAAILVVMLILLKLISRYKRLPGVEGRYYEE